jgi:hypothetical protein
MIADLKAAVFEIRHALNAWLCNLVLSVLFFISRPVSKTLPVIGICVSFPEDSISYPCIFNKYDPIFIFTHSRNDWAYKRIRDM